MNIISQLVQFILLKREVKDIQFSPPMAVTVIAVDSLLLLMAANFINNAGIQVGEVTINRFPYSAALSYSILYVGLFYSFFAAQEKQARFIQAAIAFFGTSVILTLANVIVAPLPGAGILILALAFLKIFCSVRVLTQSLGYSALRAAFSLLGISMMSYLIATTIFPIQATQTPSTTTEVQNTLSQ